VSISSVNRYNDLSNWICKYGVIHKGPEDMHTYEPSYTWTRHGESRAIFIPKPAIESVKQMNPDERLVYIDTHMNEKYPPEVDMEQDDINAWRMRIHE
jgi:hypothetical protein